MKWSLDMFKQLFETSKLEAFIYRYKTTGTPIPDEYMTDAVRERMTGESKKIWRPEIMVETITIAEEPSTEIEHVETEKKVIVKKPLKK